MICHQSWLSDEHHNFLTLVPLGFYNLIICSNSHFDCCHLLYLINWNLQQQFIKSILFKSCSDCSKKLFFSITIFSRSEQFSKQNTNLYVHYTLWSCSIDTVQDFLIKMGIKPRIHLWEISIFSLNNVIVRPTKIMNRPNKKWVQL